MATSMLWVIAFEKLLLKAQVASRFDADADKLRAYSLCVGCRGQARIKGRSEPVTMPGQPVVV